MSNTCDVLVLGSFPAATAEEAMRRMAEGLGGLVKRLPDGEVGARDQWIGWQEKVLKDNPAFEPVPREQDRSRREEQREHQSRVALPPRYRLHRRRPGAPLFPPLGFAKEAQSSYEAFARLKRAGEIASDMKFQVSLPTSIAFLEHLIVTEDQADVEAAYEKSLSDEVAEIARFVPGGELAVQWDVSKEFAIIEGLWPIHFQNHEEGIVERLARHGDAVPRPAELGFHFCYGDFGHKHWKEPDDTGNMVKIANGLFGRIRRKIDWLHMPVPRNRVDDAYYAPLLGLRSPAGTRVYLGLVHRTDGLAGSLRRAEVARKYLHDFGVATECGMGRRKPETIPELLKIHCEVCEKLSSRGELDSA